MKRFEYFRKPNKFKTLKLAAVSLLLVMLTAVGATASWIEDVSRVEFSSNDGQETPLHIGSKILYSDAVMRNMTTTSVNLNDYFQKSGDMHLSPCFSNGEDFYFPVERGTGYRVGTKDDANVNYLSVTFRVRSEGAATAYWFEKTGSTPFVSFKNGEADASGLEKNMRVSITVDGATSVYVIDDPDTSGYQTSYRTVENNSLTTKTDGRSVEQYCYYQEVFNNDNSSNATENAKLANQGAGGNLNGNTLFTVNEYDDKKKSTTVKTVTVKIWLEGNADGTAPISGIDLSNINLNIVSGWEKKRRIYVADKTINQWDSGLNAFTGANWLTNSGKLFWAIKDKEEDLHWGETGTVNAQKPYFDIPAVYNNTGTTLYRCNTGWNTGNTHTPINYWDKYDTVFPNTFHSETFSVYSKTFGTWEPDSNVHCVYFADTAFFTNGEFSNGVYDYMWDSNSVHGTGINDKVVKNANWPGLQMDTIVRKKIRDADTEEMYVYAFFYNSDYDRIIFNDGDVPNANVNQEYQTQDLWLTNAQGQPMNIVNGTFDMATLTWFHTNPNKSDWSTKIPSYSNSSTYLYGNFSTNNRWKKTHFAYDGEFDNNNLSNEAFVGTSSSKMLCKIYNKVSKDTHKLFFKNTGSWSAVKAYFWGGTNQNMAAWPGYSMTLYKDDIYVVDIPSGATHVQFNDGTNNNKFDNITINPGMVYNNDINSKWEEQTSDFEMKLVYNGTYYGARSDWDHRLYPENNYTLYSNNGTNGSEENITVKNLKHNTVYRFYLSFSNGTPVIHLAEGEAHNTD